MLTLAVALAIIVALLRGGSFKAIERSTLRGIPLALAAFAIKLAAVRLCSGALPREPWYALMLSVSYALCFAFVGLNKKCKWFAALFAAGAALNFAVIALNGFYMPVSAGASGMAGVVEIPQSAAVAYRLADEATRLGFLGDIIFIPAPLIGGFASIGDIFMAAGVFALVQRITGAEKERRALG